MFAYDNNFSMFVAESWMHRMKSTTGNMVEHL